MMWSENHGLGNSDDFVSDWEGLRPTALEQPRSGENDGERCGVLSNCSCRLAHLREAEAQPGAQRTNTIEETGAFAQGGMS